MNKKTNKFDKKKCGKGNKPKDKVISATKEVVNNPEWRKFNDLLANQVMSFPFTTIASTNANVHVVNGGTITGDFNPGAIMRLDVNPSIGFSDSDTSAANQAARYLFTKLSANNMKTTQYGPQDVLMALLSLGEVVSISSYCRRALGILGTVNPRNWYYPKHVITAMGIDYNDFVEKAAIYRTRYNYIAAIASAIAFPKDIRYFESCRALFNDVFLDHTSGLAQTYMFVPATYWDLDEKAEGGSALITKTFVTPMAHDSAVSTRLFDFYLDVLESVINNLMTSSTLQYLYADVLKYVGNNGGELLAIETVADDYSVLPIYSEEVLGWIENCVVMGEPCYDALAGCTLSNNVVTDAGTNAIIYKPGFKKIMNDIDSANNYGDLTMFMEPLLNFHTDDPGVNDRIIATRFVPGNVHILSIPNNKNDVVTQATLPDHYITHVGIMSLDPTYGKLMITMYLDPTELTAQISNIEYTSLFQFHRRPRILLGSFEAVKNATTVTGFKIVYKDLTCELDNYTSVESSVMGQIQDVSNLALFRF